MSDAPVLRQDITQAINALARDWLAQKSVASPHTAATYRQAIVRATRDFTLDALPGMSRGQAAHWYTVWCSRYGVSTANVMAAALRTFWDDHADRLPAVNPWVFRRKRPPDTTHQRVLTRREVERLFAATPPGPDRVLFLLLYRTGLRISEALALTWADFQIGPDGVRCTVYGKGGRSRTVFVMPDLWDALQTLPTAGQRQARLFPGITRSIAWKHLRQCAHRAGLRDRIVSPHVLRHSFATHALEGGANVVQVQQALGHKRLDTTQIYVNLRPGTEAWAAVPPIEEEKHHGKES